MKSDLHDDVAENDDPDIDEELDAIAQGNAESLEGGLTEEGEIEAMGKAAGLKDNPEKPFRGIEKVEHRDEKRWELDPKSKDPESGIS